MSVVEPSLCVTARLLRYEASGSRNALRAEKATYWIFRAFVRRGFIAAAARGNPGVSGLSAGLSQHFQYRTIHSQGPLSTGVSISFLLFSLFWVTNSVSPPPPPPPG